MIIPHARVSNSQSFPSILNDEIIAKHCSAGGIVDEVIQHLLRAREYIKCQRLRPEMHSIQTVDRLLPRLIFMIKMV
jgi:hypothetical protein